MEERGKGKKGKREKSPRPAAHCNPSDGRNISGNKSILLELVGKGESPGQQIEIYVGFGFFSFQVFGNVSLEEIPGLWDTPSKKCLFIYLPNLGMVLSAAGEKENFP